MSSDRWPEPDAKINPEFERNPPIAQEITLEYLNTPDHPGTSVVLTATFDAATVKRINGKYLAMKLGGEQSGDPANSAPDKTQLSYLRDDGYDHDAVPGDGRYTKTFQLVDAAPMQAFVERLSGTAKAPRNTMSFVNRKMVDRPDFKTNAVNVTTGKSGPVVHIYPPAVLGPTPPNPAFVDHSLMITDLCVVEDPDRTYNPCTNYGNPNGFWTFGEVMRQQASPNPGSIATDAQTVDFILKWLDTWNKPLIVNGDILPARPTSNIVNTWLALSAANGAGPGQFLLQNCPFKLMAIVNRVDLRNSPVYGGSMNAGEARLVYCLLDQNCNAEKMTVILEYGVNKHECPEVLAWAQQWASLADYKFCDPTYLGILDDITKQFILCGTNPSNPNESSLNQLRTDEVALGSPWELREFHNMGFMKNVTVKQEPAIQYNAKVNNADVQLLAAWVNANSPTILTNTHTVPDDITGIPFLGGKAHTLTPTGTPAPGTPPVPHHWNGDPTPGSPAEIIDNDTRHMFSLATCSGCHGGETQTGFTHISPVPFGVQAPLSGFLTGDPFSPPSGPFLVPDAAGRPSYFSPDIRGFNDLWRRALDLQTLLDNGCDKMIAVINGLSFEPISSPH